MPAFGGTLSGKELNDLVSFLLTRLYIFGYLNKKGLYIYTVENLANGNIQRGKILIVK